jgi:hypothetical protein
MNGNGSVGRVAGAVGEQTGVPGFTRRRGAGVRRGRRDFFRAKLSFNDQS